MPERRLEEMRLADLTPADRNAKDHDQDSLAGSIGRFGYVEMIVVDERTGKIVAGHGRHAKLRDLEAAGAAPPEGVTVRPDGWWAPVVRGWASGDDHEAEAAGIALNRAGELGGWRRDVLLEVLDELGQTAAGIEGIGFTYGEVDDLLAQMGDVEVLAPQPTEAAHAPGGEEWAAGVRERGGGQTKAGQGMNEVVLVLQGDAFREYQAAIARLRRAWREDAIPLLVLRAMREVAARG